MQCGGPGVETPCWQCARAPAPAGADPHGLCLPAVYAARRRRFLEAIGPDAVVLLLGSRSVPRTGDTHYPFRQDSDFHYLTGFDHPGTNAVLRTDGGPPFTLFVEPREREAEIWTGHRPGVEGALADYGADAAYPAAELLDRLPKGIEGARHLYHVLGRDPRVDELLFETLENMRLRSRAGLIPPDAVRDPRAILHEMRLFKAPEELEILRRAASITREAHRAAAQRAHAGAHEYELEASLAYHFRAGGASGPAYPSIVGSGRNATILHYTANDQPLREGELVLIDAGCELDGYASDVTRTYPVGGHFAGEARAIYEVVLAAQESALGIARPGSTLEALHSAAVRSLTEGLRELGLLEGCTEDLVENGAYRRFYMHRTSHWLGLDVHDVGTYAVDGKPRPLCPGMVFTVEPGLYVSANDETAAPGFRGLGVRIEDDVLITSAGHENLTQTIPKKPADVEAWVRGA